MLAVLSLTITEKQLNMLILTAAHARQFILPIRAIILPITQPGLGYTPPFLGLTWELSCSIAAPVSCNEHHILGWNHQVWTTLISNTLDLINSHQSTSPPTHPSMHPPTHPPSLPCTHPHTFVFKFQTYLVSTSIYQLLCANVLFNYDEIIGKPMKLVLTGLGRKSLKKK